MRSEARTSAAGERVEQGGFAGIGVADERDGRHGDGLAAAALLPANPAHGFQLLLDAVQPDVDLAAVGLQLGFTRSASADAAAGLGHGLAASGQSRQLIFQLRQFDLQLTFAGPRVAGEDVQNQLRPVDDGAGQPRLHVARLGRRQVVVEQHQAGSGGSDRGDDFIELAAAHQRRRIRPAAPLNQDRRDGRAGRTGQLLKLGERGVEVEVARLGLTGWDGSSSS